MAGEFVELDIEVSGEALTDRAIDKLSDLWSTPDAPWEPNDADPEVILFETIGDIFADVAAVCAAMPGEALVQFARGFLGLEYDVGVQAVGHVDIVMVDNAGYELDAGFELMIDGHTFATNDPVVVAPGATTAAAVPITAADPGVEYNGLPGDVVEALSASLGFDHATLNAPTAGGLDAESYSDFQDKVSLELQLRGRTLVAWRDYERFAMSIQGINRAVAIGNTARKVLVILVDSAGGPVSGPIKTALAALYAYYRQVNTVVTIADATYTNVTASVTVKALPGYDLADLEDRVADRLSTVLSPSVWGVTDDPNTGSTWQNEPVVRRNKLIDVIGNVEGVDYVVVLTISTADTYAVTATDTTDLVHRTAHPFQVGQPVRFSGMTGGAGLTAGTTYYVIASGLTADDFKVSATLGGAAVNITSSMSAGLVSPAVDNGDLTMPGIVALPALQPPSSFIVVAT